MRLFSVVVTLYLKIVTLFLKPDFILLVSDCISQRFFFLVMWLYLPTDFLTIRLFISQCDFISCCVTFFFITMWLFHEFATAYLPIVTLYLTTWLYISKLWIYFSKLNLYIFQLWLYISQCDSILQCDFISARWVFILQCDFISYIDFLLNLAMQLYLLDCISPNCDFLTVWFISQCYCISLKCVYYLKMFLCLFLYKLVYHN